MNDAGTGTSGTGDAYSYVQYVHSSIPGRLLASSNGVIARALNNLSVSCAADADGGATCSSAQAQASCAAGMSYSDLPCECGPDGRLLGSAVAYILKWAKVAIKKTAHAYLSSPLLLALLPLLVGCAVGVGAAWWWLGGGGGGGGGAAGSGIATGCDGGKSEEHLRTKNSKSRHTCTHVCTGTCTHDTVAGSSTTRTSSKSGTSRSRVVDVRSTVLILTTATQTVLGALFHTMFDAKIRGNAELAEREHTARQHLSSDANTNRESGVPLSSVPRHIAVIMDGNRRYGRQRYGSATRGHWDGSKTLADFAKWCIAEGVQVLTVYAFSTENWDRDPDEVAALMAIFVRYCKELREEALVRGIRLRVLSTEADRIPADVAAGLKRMVEETAHCDKLLMNICLSYGSRGEMVHACRSLAADVQQGKMSSSDITENVITGRLLTGDCPDPDIVMRTSGEMRLSNFLLWQIAYSEMFFVERTWPELTKDDLIKVIQNFANDRQRRYGK